MRFLALDMGDKTHAAGVMLVGRVVQTLRFVQYHAGFGRMAFAGGGILLFRTSRGRVFDYTCVSLLPQVLRAALLSSKVLLSTHLGGKPRERVIDCARRYVGAKQGHPQAQSITRSRGLPPKIGRAHV